MAYGSAATPIRAPAATLATSPPAPAPAKWATGRRAVLAGGLLFAVLGLASTFGPVPSGVSVKVQMVADVALTTTEMSARGNCLDKLHSSLVDSTEKAKAVYKAAKGDDYVESGHLIKGFDLSEAFANAKKGNALDDPDYMKVAIALANREAVGTYIKALSVADTCDHEDAETRKRYPTVYDLTSAQCKHARVAVHNFESTHGLTKLVATCVHVCSPGEGLTGSGIAGACEPCRAGKTFNAIDDKLPCAPVTTHCPDGHTLEHSTDAGKDNQCIAPAPVELTEQEALGSDPSALPSGLCIDSCMNPANCHPLGEFVPSTGNFHGAMKCIDCCCGNWEGIWDHEFFDMKCQGAGF